VFGPTNIATSKGVPVAYFVRNHYHSTLHVPDLDEATSFFDRAFARESKVLGEYFGAGERDIVAGFPRDYATFTPIAEVQLECVDPSRLLVDGLHPHEQVTEPRLDGLAWFVDGIEDLWTALRRRKIRGTDMASRIHDGEDAPLDVSSRPIIFTVPEDAGMSYEFCLYVAHRDPRGYPPVPALSPSDPLGIECCSHHTVLTKEPERACGLLVDVLGGRVIHEARRDVLATQSTYVALADGVIEVARPLEDGSPSMEDWQRNAPLDTYSSLTWKVGDLDRVVDRLKAAGVGLRLQTESLVVTDPADSLGVAWGFTTVLCPGDPRGSQERGEDK
jgi:catechol 2,3-dioxygenase-like lactoylglutathione lyase family enzyme